MGREESFLDFVWKLKSNGEIDLKLIEREMYFREWCHDFSTVEAFDEKEAILRSLHESQFMYRSLIPATIPSQHDGQYFFSFSGIRKYIVSKYENCTSLIKQHERAGGRTDLDIYQDKGKRRNGLFVEDTEREEEDDVNEEEQVIHFASGSFK